MGSCCTCCQVATDILATLTPVANERSSGDMSQWLRLTEYATRDVQDVRMSKDSKQNDMLMWFGAARNASLADIESGLARGVKVDALCSWRHGRTALWLASFGGHASVVSRLIEANARVDCQDIGLDDDTPLHAAVYNGHAEVVQILIKAGASSHVKNANGKTARDLAAARFAANGNNVSAHAILALLEGKCGMLRSPLATVGDPAVRRRRATWHDGEHAGETRTLSMGGANALARARASRQQHKS